MARVPRRKLVAEGSTNHCTWRSHNFEFVLESDDAKRKFLELLAKYAPVFGILILSYCLMSNHPHVQVRSTLGQEAFSRFWRQVNWCFAWWSNRRTRVRGQVVMERLKSPQVQDGRHQIRVMRYGDLNPVRAGLAQSASDWQWSSHRHYAYGETNPLITDAPEYLALGRTAAERRKAYLHLFARSLAEELMERRPDLVERPFVGDGSWVRRRSLACGLPFG